MTEDEIVERLTRTAEESETVDRVALAIEETMFAPHELPVDAELHSKYRGTALHAIEAFKASLADDGFVIHRFHHWKRLSRHGSRVCVRCAAIEGGIMALESCPRTKAQ